MSFDGDGSRGAGDRQASIHESSVVTTHIESYRIPKIPTFFRDDPALWFLQIEASFRNARITQDRTKADIVIAALDYEVIPSVRDLISALPQPDDLYERIKERLVATFSVSAEKRLRQLLKGEVLTDGKPSLTLYRLRNLNDIRCSDAVIKSIFLEQLPSQCRAILASANVEDLQKLAELADQDDEATALDRNSVAPISANDE